MTPNHMRFERQHLPIGDDQIPVLVASEGNQPRAVFMSYDAFLELTATLYTAVEALRAAGVDPASLGSPEDEDTEAEDEPLSPTPRDQAEFAAWDASFEQRPHLRLVVGG